MDNINAKSSSSDTNDDDNNVIKLSPLVEQLQLTNQVGGPSFCDKVLLDALHFLKRKEHAQVRLTNRLLSGLSHAACARYPPREVHWLEVRGVREETGPRMVANSMLVRSSGDSFCVDFPAVEPPDDIGHLSGLNIYDFIGPKLLQFLHVSARLLGKCRMVFDDFDNFIRHHSIDFILRFFGLFPSAIRSIELRRFSSLAAPLLRDHPAMFDCTELRVDCLDSFPLDTLHGWLHLDEQQPPKQQTDRFLVIDSKNEVQLDHSIDSVASFVQQLRQRFLRATSCCPFTVRIGLCGGGPHSLKLQPFVEDNGRTGELLEFRRIMLHRIFYQMKRKRRESAAGQDESDGEAEKNAWVCIKKVVQGDK